MPPKRIGESEDVIRRAFEALNARDLDAGKRLMAADVELDTLFTSVAGRPYRGHSGVERWATDVEESWEEMKQTPERFVPIDSERTVVVTRIQARGRASGVDVDQTIASIFTVRAGRVTRIESHLTVEDAVNAAQHEG